jgi:hypothetical protein
VPLAYAPYDEWVLSLTAASLVQLEGDGGGGGGAGSGGGAGASEASLAWCRLSGDDHTRASVVQRFDVAVIISTCVLPSALAGRLAQLRVRARLLKLAFAVSASQRDQILRSHAAISAAMAQALLGPQSTGAPARCP